MCHNQHNFYRVSTKLLLDGLDLFAPGGTKHHDLLFMWCYLEDFLDISAHINRFKNTITFVKDKIVDEIKLEEFVEC